MRFLVLLLPLAVGVAGLRAKELFVAPEGTDDAPGTLAKPLAGLMKAQALAEPGDTVWIRGGVYKLKPDRIAREHRVWT